MKGISKNILSTTTILIESTADQSTSRGTGFLFGFKIADDEGIPLLITNKHVLKNTEQVKLRLSLSAPEDHSRKIGIAEYTITTGIESLVFHHPEPDVDLAAISIASILDDLTKSGISGHGTMFSEKDIIEGEELASLGIAEEIVMVGYPTGLSDDVNNLPIVRQGIIASDPNVNFKGKRQFVIDCACYHGSSGSPVILKEKQCLNLVDGMVSLDIRRNALMGILFAGPTTTTQGRITVKNIPTTGGEAAEFDHLINLGYVIPASMILDLKSAVLARSSGGLIDFTKTINMF